MCHIMGFTVVEQWSPRGTIEIFPEMANGVKHLLGHLLSR